MYVQNEAGEMDLEKRGLSANDDIDRMTLFSSNDFKIH